MNFDRNSFSKETVTAAGHALKIRAWRDLVYVEKPVNPAFQRMNLYVPEDYYQGEKINGYDLHSAPIFMPNGVGGYMPGEALEPGERIRMGITEPNTVFRALQHGYVVAAPAIRGRSQKDERGFYTGKAPACIVDYKAAVRYLRQFAQDIPGDTEKIITNGTSAGGALSSLMGATGDHPDYEPYLEAIGAARTSDRIFAASCYCPIINLDNADTAYEWQFVGVNDYHRTKPALGEDGQIHWVPDEGRMSKLQIFVSQELSRLFPAYLNGLCVKDENGNVLTLDADGEGSFLEYMKKVVLKSAQRALDAGADLSDKTWLTVKEGRALAMDWKAYVKDITRMKCAPSFDFLSMDSTENDLFGTAAEGCMHFTDYSRNYSLKGGLMADEKIVKMMNPMHYIFDEKAAAAKHFRIRHGERDRDTSLAISAIFSLKLAESGCSVDYHSPWDVPHDGDYDLEELFAWVDGICREQ